MNKIILTLLYSTFFCLWSCSSSSNNESSLFASPDVGGADSVSPTTDGPSTLEVPVFSGFNINHSSSTDIGISETLTIEALDQNGNRLNSFTGSLALNISDTSSSYNPTIDFSSSDGGYKNITFLMGSIGTHQVQIDYETFAHSENITVTDTQCPGRELNFLSSISSASESNSSALFTISMSSSCNNDVTLRVVSANGTANNGEDFTAIDQIVTIYAGSTSTGFSVDIQDDTNVEADENFNVEIISSTLSTSIGTNSMHTYTILDDDSTPACPNGILSFTSPSQTVNEADGSISIDLGLDQACSSVVEVDYSVISLTAIEGTDFTISNGTLSIPANATSASLTVNLSDDTEAELTESFRVVLSSVRPLANELGLSVHTVIIEDNDGGAAPCNETISFASNNSSVLEDVGSKTFTLNLSSACSQDVTLNYYSSHISTDGTDLGLNNGPISIPAGSTSATFSLDISDDLDSESDESFQVSLGNLNLTELTLGTSVHVVSIIDNDNSFSNYYVRTSGDDSNDGLSAANAFLTVAQALSSVSPGDRIFIGAGTYSGALTPPTGTSTNSIQIIGDSTGSNTGDAGEIIFEAPSQTIVTLSDVAYLEFNNITFQNATMAFYAFGSVSSDNIVVKNSTFRNLSTGAIVIFQSQSFYIEHCEFDAAGYYPILIYNGSSDVRIINNIIHSGSYGIFLGTGVPSTVIKNNTFYNNSYHIYLAGNDVIEVENNIFSNGSYAIYDAGGISASTITNTYNLYWANTTNFNTASLGAGEIVANPLFVNPGTDFHLDPTSPAIDAGNVSSNSVVFSDGSHLGQKASRSDLVLDGDALLGDNSTINFGHHY